MCFRNCGRILSVFCAAGLLNASFVLAEDKPGGRQIEAKPSVEAPAPDITGVMSPEQLKQLSDLRAAIELAETQLRLEGIEAQRIEQRKKLEELIMPPAPVEPEPSSEKEREAEAISRVFPMPGGNPQVTAIIGGNRKALEATLKFPSGAIYEVTKGMILEGGYIVAKVSGNGVVLEKNGLALSMPVSQGEIQKPWAGGQEDNAPEQGTPVNP